MAALDAMMEAETKRRRFMKQSSPRLDYERIDIESDHDALSFYPILQ